MKNEIWKDIPNYEGLYQASNLGNLRSLNYKKTGKIQNLKQAKNRNGYCLCALHKNGKLKSHLVHRLIAYTFLEISTLVINHKNGVKTDNRIENLEFVTQKDNIIHGQKIGLYKNRNKLTSERFKKMVGEDNYFCKLSNEKVKEIRRLYKTKLYTQKELGEIFGVAGPVISNIVNYKTWKHI